MPLKLAPLFLLFVLTVNSLRGQQLSEYEYPENIQKLIDDAAECLKTEADSCHLIYLDAIKQSKEANNPELLGNVYTHAANTYKFMQGPPDQFNFLLNQGLNALRASKEWKSLNRLYRGKAEYIQFYEPSSSAIVYIDSAISVGQKANDFELLTATYAEKARAHENEGDIDKSIENLVISKNYAEKSGDKNMIAMALFGLGATHAVNEDFEIADDYYRQTLNIQLELKDSIRYYYAMTNWCHNLISLGDYQRAVDSLSEVIDFSQHKGQKIVVPFAQSQLSRAYHFLGKYDLAITEAKKSLERSKELSLFEHKSYNEMLISRNYLELSMPQKALDYSYDAFNFSKHQRLSGDQMEIFENHAKILEQNGLYNESLQVYKLYSQKKDSIFNEEKSSKITLLQSQLEFEEKENEICSQESEISLLEEKNKTATNRNIALIIGIILLAAVAYALFNRQKLKTEEERRVAEKQRFENEKLNKEIEFKNRELTSNALTLARKNQFLSEVDSHLQNIKKSDELDSQVQQIRNQIKVEAQMEKNWSLFTEQFKNTNPVFYKNLTNKYSSLSKNELRMAALIKMKLTSKDIAHMLNISDEGVKKARYRMRKKFALQKEESLENHISSLS